MRRPNLATRYWETILPRSRAHRIFSSAPFLVFTLLLGGCSQHQPVESPDTHAYRLIDDQRDDEAISYMEQVSAAEPANAQHKVTLASAYAHKAGVKVQALWPLVSAAKSASSITAPFGADPASTATPEEKVDSFLNRLANVIIHFAQGLQIYAVIPNVKNDNLPYLNQAIYLLDSIDGISPGDALFRALLKILKFKSSLANDLITDGATPVASLSQCDIDFVKVGALATKYANQLGEILHDVGISQPDQAKTLEVTRTNMTSFAAELTSNLSSAIVNSIAIDAMLKQTIIEQNFGKLLKCEGAANVNP